MSTRLRAGEQCAGHEIIQHLGTGRSAEVYAARLPGGELRALKIMAVEGPRAATLAARFAQEGEVLAMIVHPAVVRVHDAGVAGDRVWLSLELAPGETLGQRLRTRGCPPLDDLLGALQQACEGLAEAHRVGVVHRDLSPDKLLLVPGGAVKVIDFGMAKLRTCGVKTTEEQQIGAARYQAPEQVCGKPAHPGMDVYALGHVLYEALSGEHAMGTAPRSLYETVRWQIHTRPRPLRERVPTLPSDLADLVDRALEKDPALRPPSMRAFGEALREVRVRLRAPVLRAARNLPRATRDPAQAPTVSMAAALDAARAVRELGNAPTVPMAAVLDAPSPARAALLPAAPTLSSVRSSSLVAKTIPMAAVAPMSTSPDALRSTDAPVEITVAPDVTKRRPIVAAGLLLGATALVASVAAWMVFGPALSGSPAPPRPAPAASPPPPPSARPALTSAPSGSAPRTPGPPPRAPLGKSARSGGGT